MLKTRYWIGVITAPILLVSAGCNISPRPHSTAKRVMTPDRLMSMALTFERQGHINQAKTAYRQILAMQPDYPEARENLDTLIANEMNPGRKDPAITGKKSDQLLAKSNAPAGAVARRKSAVPEKAPSKSTKIAASSPVNESPVNESVIDDAKTVRDENSSLTRTVSHDSIPPSRRQIDDPFPDAVVNATIARTEPAASVPSSSTGAVVQELDDAEEPKLAATKSEPLKRSASVEPVDDDRERREAIIAATLTSRSPISRPAAVEELDEQEPEESNIAAAAPTLPANSDPLETEDPADREPFEPFAAEPRISRATSSAVVADEAPAGDLEEPIVAEVFPVPSTVVDPAIVDEPIDGGFQEPVIAAAQPAPTSITDSNGTAQQDRPEAEESITFELPIVQRAHEVDADLEPFLGTFHVRMIQSVKSNREKIQPKLAKLAADQDAETEDRSRAVFLLGAIGPDAIQVVPVLRREMHYDVDEFLRVDLSEAILKIQPEDADAIQVLVDCLKETDENVRWVAAFALRNAVSPRTTFVIDALRDTLKTDDLKLRRMVFLTLAEFGPAAAKAIPELEAALESPDPATREVARASLESIAPDRKTSETIEKVSHRVPSTENN